MIECNVEQRTKEWYELRKGKVTGTKLKKVFTSNNLPLIDELIAEIHSNEIEETFVTPAMQRGIDLEPVVFDYYNQLNEVKMEEVGFCLSEEFDFLGLSPDGMSSDRLKALEIKCPSTQKHVSYIRMNKIPAEYKFQILNYFIVNPDLYSLDFVSFDDRFAPKPYWQKTVTRLELTGEIEETKEGLTKFWEKYLKYYKEIVS